MPDTISSKLANNKRARRTLMELSSSIEWIGWNTGLYLFFRHTSTKRPEYQQTGARQVPGQLFASNVKGSNRRINRDVNAGAKSGARSTTQRNHSPPTLETTAHPSKPKDTRRKSKPRERTAICISFPNHIHPGDAQEQQQERDRRFPQRLSPTRPGQALASEPAHFRELPAGERQLPLVSGQV